MGNAKYFCISDVENQHNYFVEITNEKQGLAIRPERTGCYEGSFAPVYLEFVNGRPKLYVWANINQEDPTHVIDLRLAMESMRIY